MTDRGLDSSSCLWYVPPSAVAPCGKWFSCFAYCLGACSSRSTIIHGMVLWMSVRTLRKNHEGQHLRNSPFDKITLQVDLDRLYDRVRNIREICDNGRRSLVVEGAGDDHLGFPPKEIVLRNVLLIADKFLQQVRMQLQMQALIKAAQPQPRPGAEQPKTNRTDEGEDPAPVEPAADAPALVSFPPLPPVPTITQPSATMFVVAQAMLGEMSKRRWAPSPIASTRSRVRTMPLASTLLMAGWTRNCSGSSTAWTVTSRRCSTRLCLASRHGDKLAENPDIRRSWS